MYQNITTINHINKKQKNSDNWENLNIDIIYNINFKFTEYDSSAVII